MVAVAFDPILDGVRTSTEWYFEFVRFRATIVLCRRGGGETRDRRGGPSHRARSPPANRGRPEAFERRPGDGAGLSSRDARERLAKLPVAVGSHSEHADLRARRRSGSFVNDTKYRPASRDRARGSHPRGQPREAKVGKDRETKGRNDCSSVARDGEIILLGRFLDSEFRFVDFAVPRKDPGPTSPPPSGQDGLRALAWIARPG